MTAALCLQYIFAEVKKEKVPGIVHFLFVTWTKHMVFLSLIYDINLPNISLWHLWRLRQKVLNQGFSTIDKYEFKLFYMNEDNTDLILFVLIIF